MPATFFTTGGTAEARPETVTAIVAGGHGLACHGYSHNNFRMMDAVTARDEIARTNAILRQHAPVTSFRAPYLSFPEAYVPILADEGFTVDSSRGVYKRNEPRHAGAGMRFRLEASVTSSVLRIPHLVRNPWFAMLKSPVTLFVHPWEFVDRTQTGIRYDCRFRTGQPALDRLRTTLRWFKVRDFDLRLVHEAPALAA